MDHIGTQRIETQRLTLRRFKHSDAEMMYRNWANDDEVTKFLTWPTHQNSNITAALMEAWVMGYEDPETYQWCIEYKENSEAIGSITVVSMLDRVESVEIGYCIGRHYWNQGIMTEAVKEVVDFLFTKVGVNRIEAHADPRNTGSGSVLLKSGFSYTGLRRQIAINNTGICDVKTYELIKENYQQEGDATYYITDYLSTFHDSWVRCKALSYLYSQFTDQISAQKDAYSEEDGYIKTIELVALAEEGKVIGILDVGIYNDERNKNDPYVSHLKRGAYMDVLAVHPDYQGKGVAQKLLQTAFEQLRKEAVEYVTIFTRDDQPANRLYQKIGAELIATDYRIKGNLKEATQDIGSFIVNYPEKKIEVRDGYGKEVPYMDDSGYYWVYDEKYLDLFDIEECVLEHSYVVYL